MKKIINYVLLVSITVFGLMACHRGVNRPVIENAVPGNCSQALIMPSANLTIEAMGTLVANVSKTITTGEVDRFRNSLKMKFGIDPTNVTDYEAIGVDPKGGVAFFTYNGEVKNGAGYIIVLPINNDKRFNEQLALFWGRVQEGAVQRQQKVVGNKTFEVLQTEGKEPFFYIIDNGYAYLTNKDSYLAELGSFLEVRTGRELKNSLKYQELIKRVQPKGLFYAFNNDKPPFTKKLAGIVDGALLDFNVKPDGFELSGQLQMGIATAAGFKQLFAQGKIGDALDNIPEDSLVYGVASADLSMFKSRLMGLAVGAGIVPEAVADNFKDLVDNLQQPYSLSLRLGDIVSIIPYLKEGKIAQRKSEIMLNLMLLDVTAKVQDKEAAMQLLDNLKPHISEKMGQEIIKESRADGALYIPASEANMGFALQNNSFIYAAGSNYLRQLLDKPWRLSAEVDKDLQNHEKGLLEKSGAVVSLRFSALAKALDSLATGPLKSLVEPASGGQSLPSKLAELLSKLNALTVSVTNNNYGDSCDLRISFSYRPTND